MTEDEFFKRWRLPLAGLALCGLAVEAKGGPLERAANALELPETVEKFLRAMWKDARGETAAGVPVEAVLKAAGVNQKAAPPDRVPLTERRVA